MERLLAQTDYQDVPLALVPPARAAPLGVLVRGALEWLLDDQILEALTRSPRGPKKAPAPKPVYNKQHKHYATARLLEQEENAC